MKYEMLLLRSLFVACLLVCGLVLGSMLAARPGQSRLADRVGANATSVAALGCPLPPDGLVCLGHAS